MLLTFKDKEFSEKSQIFFWKFLSFCAHCDETRLDAGLLRWHKIKPAGQGRVYIANIAFFYCNGKNRQSMAHIKGTRRKKLKKRIQELLHSNYFRFWIMLPLFYLFTVYTAYYGERNRSIYSIGDSYWYFLFAFITGVVRFSPAIFQTKRFWKRRRSQRPRAPYNLRPVKGRNAIGNRLARGSRRNHNQKPQSPHLLRRRNHRRQIWKPLEHGPLRRNHHDKRRGAPAPLGRSIMEVCSFHLIFIKNCDIII